MTTVGGSTACPHPCASSSLEQGLAQEWGQAMDPPMYYATKCL